MLPENFIPTKPFYNFKWKWACLQCTEGLNDPVILLGVLFRMRKLEPLKVKYNSPEFTNELIELANDTKDSVIGVDLARRTGERNLIRNSGQYWRALGLIPRDSRGEIELTDFGRDVADHKISQTEFAAITIQTFRLPNPNIQPPEECKEWLDNNLIIYPLKLILSILCKLETMNQGFITTEELVKIIIPLSGCKATIQDYTNFILKYRAGEHSLIGWPDCCPSANDLRIAREFLIFLSHYGYLNYPIGKTRLEEKYHINQILLDEILQLINQAPNEDNLVESVIEIRKTEIASELERKRIQQSKTIRPNQAAFRRAILKACERCIISNVMMPEVLEAAHIKPVKYNGDDTIANGFAMRADIHTLFDSGHLRISTEGNIELSSRARMDYGASIPPRVVIPEFTNKDFLRWRWENYNGI